MSLNNHYYYNVMRKTLVQFVDIFNDINIARYDQDGNITKFIKVPVKVSPKTKQWYWTELRDNKDRRDSIFPMMAVDLTNIEYAKDRQVNKNVKVTATSNGSSIDRFFNPVPYDFNFTVQVSSEYIMDITQIFEQVLPFFSPEAYIRITVPELNITEDGQVGTNSLDLRVVYESIDSTAPVGLEEAGCRILLWSLNFTVQGYLFLPMILNEGIVNKVVQAYYLSEDAWSKRDGDLDKMPYEVGNSQLHGVTYSPTLPLPDEPIDDSYRRMIKYEHYPSYCNNVVLYTTPSSTDIILTYPVNVTISSSIPVESIWYTVTEITNEYILDDNLDYIIQRGRYVIVGSDGEVKPTFQYLEPITLGEGMKIYLIEYLGICLNGSITKIFSTIIDMMTAIETYIIDNNGEYITEDDELITLDNYV